MVVVDDHAMFRSGVKAEIGQSVQVVGEAADAETAIKVVLATKPGRGAARRPPAGRRRHRGAQEGARAERRINVSSRLSVSDAAEDVIGVIRAGARGYVTKSISGPELIAAIRRVADGDAVFSPRLAGFVLDAFSGAIDIASVDEDLDRLSAREREVLRLIARGLRVQGGGEGAVHLDQDGRDARQQRAAQAPALQPAPADPLGHRPPTGLSLGAPDLGP